MQRPCSTYRSIFRLLFARNGPVPVYRARIGNEKNSFSTLYQESAFFGEIMTSGKNAACDWSLKFKLKINRSVRTPCEEYGVVAAGLVQRLLPNAITSL